MHYKLMGFRQDGGIRRFRFHRVEIGVPPIPFTVLADTSLARTFKLSLQELPSLCSRLLSAVDRSATGTLVLSEADMSLGAAENAAAAAQIDAARALRSRRSSLASMARKSDIESGAQLADRVAQPSRFHPHSQSEQAANLRRGL